MTKVTNENVIIFNFEKCTLVTVLIWHSFGVNWSLGTWVMTVSVGIVIFELVHGDIGDGVTTKKIEVMVLNPFDFLFVFFLILYVHI